MGLSSLLSQLRPPANLPTNPYQAGVQSRIAELGGTGTGIGNAQLAANELSALSAPAAAPAASAAMPGWAAAEFQGLGAASAPAAAATGGEGIAASAPGLLGRLGPKARIAAPFLAGQIVDAGASRGGRYLAQHEGNSIGTRLAANTATVLGDTAAGAGAGASAGSVVPVLGTAVGGLVGGTAGAIKGGFSAWNNQSNPEYAGAARNNDFNKFNEALMDVPAGPTFKYFHTQAQQLLGEDVSKKERKANLKQLQAALKQELAQPGSVVPADQLMAQQPQMDPQQVLQQQMAIAQVMAPYLQQVQQSGDLASQVYGGLGSSLPAPFQGVAQAQAAQAKANANNLAAAMAGQAQTLPYANQIAMQNAALNQLAQQMASQNNASSSGSLTQVPAPTATK